MPIFEFICCSCRHPFETLIQGDRKPSCPSCGSGDLEKQLSVFAVNGGGGPSDATALPGSCGTCGDPRGPGACSLN